MVDPSKSALPSSSSLEETQDYRTAEIAVEVSAPSGLAESSEPRTSGSQSAGPAPRIGVVGKEQRPRFLSETESLLRGRLKAAAVDLMVVLGLGFAGNSLAGNFQWLTLRILILGLVIGSYGWLRRRIDLGMNVLRAIEAILFGGVALQVALMMYSRVKSAAANGDSLALLGAADFFFVAFCLHILTYGIFMPNSWRRAAVVMSIFAAVPYVVWYSLIWTDAEVASSVARQTMIWPLPAPWIAALIGTWGSHIIHRARREAFQARQILQYRLQQQIGTGGMGDVYRAEHILLKRPCAIKLIKPERAGDAATLKLFEREVIATARLSHWNTIDIYDYGHTEDGTFFYVMELLQGESLQSLVARCGPLPAGRVIGLLAQVCDALQEAHLAGLIHRDIKPANIFVTRRGGLFDVAKLLDFGLVREVATGPADVSSQRGFSGTPAYMAPEQALHYEAVDGRSDIYALGGVGCFLLTAQPPFSGKSVAELLMAHATLPPPDLTQRGIPPDLAHVLQQCLAKDPGDRMTTAAELATALRACESASQWTSELASAWWHSYAPPRVT